MRVQVYRNLHNGMWSIRNKKTRRILGHASEIHLEQVTAHVNENGRQRVLRERKKNVHAWLEGLPVFARGFTRYKSRDLYVTFTPAAPRTRHLEITYDPYNMSTFQYLDGQAFLTADYVVMDSDLQVFASHNSPDMAI